MHPVHERRLVRVRDRHDDRLDAVALQHVDEHERAGHGPDRAVEAELAEHGDVLEAVLGQLRLGEEQPERDRELESGTRLAHARGRKVDRDALERERHLRRHQGRAHALARFASRRIGESDDVISRQSLRDVHLDAHGMAVDAEQGGTTNRGEHGTSQEPMNGWEGR